MGMLEAEGPHLKGCFKLTETGTFWSFGKDCSTWKEFPTSFLGLRAMCSCSVSLGWGLLSLTSVATLLTGGWALSFLWFL